MTDTPDDTPDFSFSFISDEDLPEELLGDGHDDERYDSEDHVRALRLMLACVRQDWPARDQVIEEIGGCPDCLERVIVHLSAEAAAALVGPPQETEQGLVIPKEQTEGAAEFIGKLLAFILDRQAASTPGD